MCWRAPLILITSAGILTTTVEPNNQTQPLIFLQRNCVRWAKSHTGRFANNAGVRSLQCSLQTMEELINNLWCNYIGSNGFGSLLWDHSKRYRTWMRRPLGARQLRTRVCHPARCISLGVPHGPSSTRQWGKYQLTNVHKCDRRGTLTREPLPRPAVVSARRQRSGNSHSLTAKKIAARAWSENGVRAILV